MLISEIFAGLQGEGVSIGIPAVFVRLGACNLVCAWCDTYRLWTHSTNFSPEQVLVKVQSLGVDLNTAHLVITGGEPTLGIHRKELTEFLKLLHDNYPEIYIELETNGTLLNEELFTAVNQINCSPKLSNSEEPAQKRIKPEVLKYINKHPNSWFKFVVTSEEDWQEIQRDFLPYIDKNKVLLMPAASNRAELIKNSSFVWELALSQGVRMSTRLQTITFNNQPGK